MAGAIIGLWAAGVFIGYVDAIGLGGLSVAMLAIPVFSFIGFLRAGADIRTALTAMFVIEYFAFLAALSTSDVNQAKFDTRVGQQVWDDFTYLVGVIVVFYFGVSAAVEITKQVKQFTGFDETTDEPKRTGELASRATDEA